MPSLSSQVRLPTRTSDPSSRAATPRPGVALKSVTAGSSTPRSAAARTTACASGCSEKRSAPAATASTRSEVQPESDSQVQQLRPSFSQGAGLVEDHRRQALDPFHHPASFDQDAATRGHATARHDGRRAWPGRVRTDTQ
jgi:hypothetical protein